MRVIFLSLCLSVLTGIAGYSQPCSTLGQTPSTAFPVCGTTIFNQTTVPICRTNDLYVPSCPATDGYGDKNPFYYKFTCYVGGTLEFLITPNDLNDDYDWQLYDITGHNPNDIYTDHSLVVTGNWSGNSSLESARGYTGITGTKVGATDVFICATNPPELGGQPPFTDSTTFNKMPTLIQGHEYLLMVSHFTNSQSGYGLSFGGGTAVITDPLAPHLLKTSIDCDGKVLGIKLNKRMKCSTVTASGSEFSISPAAATVVSAVAEGCSSAFDFDSLTITLSNTVLAGNYQLLINNGTDANTISDICGQFIPQNEQIPFTYVLPQPTPFDSIGHINCSPDSVIIYFPKRIDCSTIASDGSDFAVTGPTPVTVATAYGNCVNGKTNTITVKFTAPIYTKGNYLLIMKTGVDGNTVVDECGRTSPPQTMPFTTADTVSADFAYVTAFDCLSNTLTFSHDGAHDVNSWNWLFNNTIAATTQSYTIAFGATSSNTAQLTVTNGVCTDSLSKTISFNNKVQAAFLMPDIICPEDPLIVKDTSSGQVDQWLWKYDVLGTNNQQTPPPFYFPNDNIERYYTIKLIVTNNTLNCSDSARKVIRVLNNCVIAVPNAFTPNNDGLNDFFWPHNAIKADNLEFKVYNRWGQLVFISRNWMDKWNGKFNGFEQPAGVYVWFLRYTNRNSGQKVFQKGTVMLIR